MFDFEKFHVYKKSEEVFKKISHILKRVKVLSIKDQMYRSSTSIILNIAEGAGKYGKRDKRRYYAIARGSTQETVAILRILKVEGCLNENEYSDIYNDLEEISKMLSGLINKMNS